MSEDYTHQFEWYLVEEREKARCFSANEKGLKPFWIPRSQILAFSKYPPKGFGDLPLCLVEIPEWLAREKGLI